jgi:hypothetical protein
MTAPARRQEVAKPAPAAVPGTMRRIDLAAILEPNLAVGKQAREWSYFVEKVPFLSPMRVDDVSTLTEQQLNNCRERALSRHKKLPPLDDLFHWEGRFDLAVREAADEASIRVMIGVMFDSFPGKATEIGSAIRLDALTLLLLDFDSDFDDARYGSKRYSHAVLAWAVRRALRKLSFAPSAQEFLDICHKVRNSFIAARAATSRMIELRIDAELFLEQTGDIQTKSEGIDDDIPF